MIWHGSSEQEDSNSNIDLDELVLVAKQVGHALRERQSRLCIKEAIDKFRIPRRQEFKTEGEYKSAVIGVTKRMEPVARMSLRGPFATEGVSVVLQADTRSLAVSLTPPVTGGRTQIDGLLFAVHQLSDVAVHGECPWRQLVERFPLCPAHAADEKKQGYEPDGAEVHEAQRRKLAAEFLITSAPARIRGLLAAAIREPKARPWPMCPPPFACPILDGWAKKYDTAQHTYLQFVQQQQQQRQQR